MYLYLGGWGKIGLGFTVSSRQAWAKIMKIALDHTFSRSVKLFVSEVEAHCKGKGTGLKEKRQQI